MSYVFLVQALSWYGLIFHQLTACCWWAFKPVVLRVSYSAERGDVSLV